MTEKEIFEYTYSASQQSEVRKIREKYLPKEVTKLDQLRALDACRPRGPKESDTTEPLN